MLAFGTRRITSAAQMTAGLAVLAVAALKMWPWIHNRRRRRKTERGQRSSSRPKDLQVGEYEQSSQVEERSSEKQEDGSENAFDRECNGARSLGVIGINEEVADSCEVGEELEVNDEDADIEVQRKRVDEIFSQPWTIWPNVLEEVRDESAGIDELRAILEVERAMTTAGLVAAAPVAESPDYNLFGGTCLFPSTTNPSTSIPEVADSTLGAAATWCPQEDAVLSEWGYKTASAPSYPGEACLYSPAMMSLRTWTPQLVDYGGPRNDTFSMSAAEIVEFTAKALPCLADRQTTSATPPEHTVFETGGMDRWG